MTILKKLYTSRLENYTVGRNEITGGTVSPSYILPIQGLQRLQKIMDEYVGGVGVNYMTNKNLLKRGLDLLNGYKKTLNILELKIITSLCVHGS